MGLPTAITGKPQPVNCGSETKNDFNMFNILLKAKEKLSEVDCV